MNNDDVITVVPLTEIDVSGEECNRFLFTYNRDTVSLAESFSCVGLINPVTLFRLTGSSDKYAVVCGSLRVKVMKELGFDSIRARVLKGSVEELMMLSVHDNMFCRGFNDIEKGLVIKKFSDIGFSEERFISEIAPLLGVAPNKKVVEKYVAILGLEDEIKLSVACGEVELEKALVLLQFDRTDRGFVYDLLFKESNINLNEAKEVVRNLSDLKQMKQIDITEILMADDITSIIKNEKFNKRQKGERVCMLIKQKRYPMICEQEDKFAKTCKDLGFNNNVRINHSRYFEGNEIQITMKISDEKKLEEGVEKLMVNVGNGKFKKLLAISRCSDMLEDVK